MPVNLRDQGIAVRNGAYIISIEEWRDAIERNNQRNIPFGHDIAFSTNQVNYSSLMKMNCIIKHF